MEIKHYCNSFNSFKAGKSIIVCDPWVGEAAETAWISYPVHKDGAKILNKINPDFIYISHLHCDHFDPKLLSKFKNKETKIVIKNFKIPILKNRLLKIGFKNIIECEPWKKYTLNKDISIAIIPQMSSNNGGYEEQINYDLDTSIVIQSNKTKEVFYNGVDNPLTDKNYIVVKKFISKYFNKKIAIAVLQDGAAGEYPQCFLNINRKKAKETVTKNTLLSLKKRIKILKPEAYFSGTPGAVMIGKFAKLNNLVAKPTSDQIKYYLQKEKSAVLEISGGGTAIRKDNEWIVKKANYDFNEKEIVEKFSKKKYFYFEKSNKVKLKNLDNIFNKSYENYIRKVNKCPIKTSWEVELCIYKNLSLNLAKKIDKKSSKFIKKYTIKYNPLKKPTRKSFSKLTCHLDLNLFYGLLTKKYTNWNQPTVGSLVLYERRPNKFDPNPLFALNFLTV